MPTSNPLPAPTPTSEPIRTDDLDGLTKEQQAIVIRARQLARDTQELFDQDDITGFTDLVERLERMLDLVLKESKFIQRRVQLTHTFEYKSQKMNVRVKKT